MKKNRILKALDTSEHKILVERLIKARITAELTQKEAADKLGKKQSFISKIEARQRHIDVIVFYKLTQIYKYDFSELLMLL